MNESSAPRTDAPEVAQSAIPVEELSFRQAMNELNSIVSELESNTLELEASLTSYERGIQLLRYLRQSLASAQQKVEVLMGELETPQDDETIDSNLSKA